MESLCVERNCLAPTHVAHFYGRRRNLVPFMYFAAAGLVDRRFFDETAKNTKFVEPDGNSSGFSMLFTGLFKYIVIQNAEEPG